MVFDHVAAQNVRRGPTRRLGSTVTVAVAPASWLALHLDLTAVDARFTGSDALVPGVPRLLGTARVVATHGAWSAALFGHAVAARPLPHGATAAPTGALDARGEWRRGRFAVALEIDDLTGARWRAGEFHYASWFDRTEPRSALPRTHLSPGRPFGLRLSLSTWL
jgi:iron complex outermembrane recepter protein